MRKSPHASPGIDTVRHVGTGDASTFDLRSLLLGALLALVASVFVQVWVIPRVDARRRREDRWERDVLALGELLSDELSKAALHARTESTTAIWLRDLPDDDLDVDPDVLGRERQRSAENARTAVRAWDELVTVRARWLVDRITDLAPESDDLRDLDRLWRTYRIGRLPLEAAAYGQPVSESEVDAAWDAERVSRTALLSAARALARRRRPPRNSWRRVWAQAWRRWTAPVSRWRIARRVARETPESESQSNP
jgi:hypothetical protein